ncbi:hypothetical protein EMIT093MI4_100091 [Pseudomonas sp. IT-93MI4]
MHFVNSTALLGFAPAAQPIGDESPHHSLGSLFLLLLNNTQANPSPATCTYTLKYPVASCYIPPYHPPQRAQRSCPIKPEFKEPE